MSSTYYTSFTPDQVTEYTDFFNTYGFVVIDNILTPEEIESSRNEIWHYLQTRSENHIKPDDPSTWTNENWPKEICRNGGFMGRFPYLKKLKLPETLIPEQPMAWANRQNEKIYHAFKNCMGFKKLWVSVDRYGIMRPTKYVMSETCDENSTVVKEEYKTKENWIHWDLSPFHFGTSAAGYAPNTDVSHESLGKEYGAIRVQGLVTLTDCPEEAGGFHCVPGFQGKRFFEWREVNKEYGDRPDICKRNFVEVPDDDPMRSEITKVPMRAGSLLIFNSQLPHGNYPNLSDNFRMVQYLKMIPVEDPREYLPAFSYAKFKPEEWLGNFQPSPLGRKLFGLDAWTDEDNF